MKASIYTQSLSSLLPLRYHKQLPRNTIIQLQSFDRVMAVSGFNTPSWRSSSPAADHLEDFTLAPFVHRCAGLLFDMDGTLIDSTNAIVKHWEEIGRTFSVDPRAILATSHGRRSIDVFQDISPAHANWDYVRSIEGKVPLKYGTDAVEIPGARDILDVLKRDVHARWTIVTSGTRPLVEGWLKVLNLSEPRTMVTAEDVEAGKPNAACYKLGKATMGLEAGADVLVIEDAPAGIRAGKAAGCKVLALATTHPTEQLWKAGADWIVRDLRSITLKSVGREDGTLEIEIRCALRK